MVIAILGGALLLCCDRAEAASFDCKKAASDIERLICEEPILDSLDTQLEGAYRGALDRSNNPARVKDMQRAWLKQRDGCAGVKCMSAAYSRQIEVLSGISDEPPACVKSFTNDDIRACAAEHYRRAENEMDRYMAAARGRLMEKEPEQSMPGLEGFDDSQVKWVAHREAECAAVYDWWSDGSIRFAKHYECLQTVTKARTATIWSIWLQYVDSTPPLLPKPAT